MPLIGETFGPNDPQQRRYEIVIGHGLWQRRFGSDRKLPGKVLDVNLINLNQVGPTPSLVVSVALTDAHFPPLSADFSSGPGVASGIGDLMDFWIPELIDPAKRDTGDLDAIARLRPGIPIPQAQAEMDANSRNLAAEHPETNAGLGVRVVPLRDEVGRSRVNGAQSFPCGLPRPIHNRGVLRLPRRVRGYPTKAHMIGS